MAIITRTRKRDGRKVYLVRLLIPGDPQRRQYSVSFDNKREAERYEAKQLSDRSLGVEVDPRKGRTPLSEVADRWLGSKPRKRESSIERDSDTIEWHLKRRHDCQGDGVPIGTRPIASITQSDIQDLVNSWWGSYAPSTVVRMYRTVQAIFSWAVDNDFRGRTPCRKIELPEVKPRDAQILDTAGLERLVKAMGDHGLMAYLAVMGPRWGEIAGLRVGRVHFSDEDPRIIIEEQRTRGTKGRMVTSATKTRNSERKGRPLALPVWLGSMLYNHLSARGGVNDEDYVFVSSEGRPLHYSNWRRRVWLPAVEAAGLDGLHFHDLRHVAATRLDEAGVSDKVKEHRLGATKAVVETVYTQATDPADRAAANLMGEVFRPSYMPPSA
jgi:integrase